MSDRRPDEDPIVSYLTLRRVVGILGIALPVLVAVWGFVLCSCSEILPSISDYYRLRTRDVFVGTLFAIGLFLLTYRGYDRRDDVAGNLACLFALTTAVFPTSGPPWEAAVHLAAAAALFLVLAYFSFFLFTKSGGSPTPEKLVRNRIYRTCAIVMVVCIALIAGYLLFLANTSLSDLKPVFWLESLALWAFGFSWFVKGETLFRDRNG